MSDDFYAGIRMIEEAHIKSLENFVAWMKKHWVLEPKDRNSLFVDEPPPSDEYRKGHDELLESLDDALACYTEDFYS